MGLDTVELVMAIEDGFGIEIPNEIAAKLTTVGLMHGYLVAELQRLAKPDQDPARVFEKLRNIICQETGVEPHEVVPEASFVDDLRLD